MQYEVFSYSVDELKRLLLQESEATDYIIQNKLHLSYFESYFKKLSAKTIIVEKDYVDKDYLEDFSFYYVRSFLPYKRFCTRLHFFTNQFTHETFSGFLKEPFSEINKNQLQENYLGFMVIKPLPKTIIGRTCLKTYPFENKRYFPFIRQYSVNLWGIELTVNSIAYQEQDSIVAACASSAIWSAFQATGLLFQHSIPSPVEITKAATKYFPYTNRHFPNKGLTPEQMAHAIRNVGLEPFLFNSLSSDITKATTYAYLKAKIPLVLCVKLIENSRDIGHHAVAITGFAFNSNLKSFKEENFFLSSSKIDKLYVHDDQVGPFARMNFNDEENSLSTSWKDSIGQIGNVKATPEILIIPLYHKIRIPFNVILKIIYQLDKIIKVISNNTNTALPNFEWDIFLSTISDFKTEILNSSELKGSYKESLLTENFPKFIWRVIGKIASDKVELLFDATDIEQGKIFIRQISHSEQLKDFLKKIAGSIPDNAVLSHQLKQIFEELRK